MLAAQLTDRRWFARQWQVDCDGVSHLVRYSGRELGRETVYVDGMVASRRTGFGRMSREYRFPLDDRHDAVLSVAIPWWCEWVALCDLSFVRLAVNGQCVYEEGRPPRRPLPTTGAAPRGFEIHGVVRRGTGTYDPTLPSSEPAP